MTYSERMVIEAKFSSVCPKCNVRIQPRESIEWKRGEAGRHIECPTVAVAVTQVVADADDRSYDAWTEIESKLEWLRGYDAKLATEVETALRAAPVARSVAPARLQVEDAGVYVLPDDSIVKMQANREKTAVYPKLFVDTSSDRLDGEAQHVRGEFRYIEDWTERRELRERVEATGRKMTLDEAKAFIRKYGRCVRCWRAIKVAKSLEQGMGDKCYSYFSEGTTGAELLGEAPAAPAEDNRQARINEWLAKKGF